MEQREKIGDRRFWDSLRGLATTPGKGVATVRNYF